MRLRDFSLAGGLEHVKGRERSRECRFASKPTEDRHPNAVAGIQQYTPFCTEWYMPDAQRQDIENRQI